jgi:hypothetical protein
MNKEMFYTGLLMFLVLFFSTLFGILYQMNLPADIVFNVVGYIMLGGLTFLSVVLMGLGLARE